MKLTSFFFIVLSAVTLRGADLQQDLFSAVKRVDLSAVEAALNQGADAKAKLKNGATPLILDADVGNQAVAEMLIKRGADVNATNAAGYTALFFAVARNNLPFVQMLLAHGAKTDEAAGNGDMPLKFAIDTADSAMIEALLVAGAPMDSALSDSDMPSVIYAVDRGDFDAVNLLLKHGANVNQPDGVGITPLSRAAEKDLPKLILLLLSKGANLNAIHKLDDDGQHNALCCASANGAAAAVRLLLAKGLDPHWDNDRAVKIAEAAGHKDIVALLKQPLGVAQEASRPSVTEDEKIAFPEMDGQIVAALSSFTTDENSWKSGQAAASFSAILQAHLGSVPHVAWVERDAIHKAETELGLQAFGVADRAAPLQLGKWLNAQLLVTGRFSADDGEGSCLTVEVLDLQRGDVLARRSRVIQMPLEKRFAFTDADVQAALPMLNGALAEAMRALASARKQVLVAPLFFRNSSATSDRLDFLEDDLMDALSKGGSQSVRVVQFPHAARAAEESELVLSGLVEANPEAWKRVADYYVWGEYEELESNGIAFDEVQIRAKLHVWDGAAKPTETAVTFRVGELREAVPRLVANVFAGLRNKPSAAPSDSVRDDLARTLHQRVKEIQTKDTSFIEAHQRTVGWLHRWRLRLQLLELAHFLAPADGAIHCDLIIERWNQAGVFHGSRDHWNPSQFRAMWRRDADWRTHVDRFGFSFLNALPQDIVTQAKLPGDIVIPGEMTRAPRQDYYVDQARVAALFIGYHVGGYPDEVPQSIHQKWRRDFTHELCRRLVQMADQCPDQFTIPTATYTKSS